MGLFSTIINRCPLLGEDFVGELQTKDLESLMDYYWLSPDGYLFLIDVGKCFRMVDNPNSDKWFDKFTWERTGERGRLRPYRRSFVARLYPVSVSKEWKEVYVFFKMGKLIEILPKEEAYLGDWGG